MSLSQFFRLLRQTASAWSDDNASTLGAALAYYTVFSLAPLLLIAISMASLILGEDAAQSGVKEQIKQTLGPVTADAITAMLDANARAGGNVSFTLIGLGALLLGASGVFGQLRASLNLIWKTQARPRTTNFVLHFLKYRLVSFTAVLGTGFLLLVSLVVNALLVALSNWLAPEAFVGSALLWRGLFLLVSFCFTTLLFALIFKLLPDERIDWHDVWLGAALTAVLFMVGQHLLGLYLALSSVASAYGAAGSLVLILVWVYYSAQIVLFGAEFTYIYATTHGSHVGLAEQTKSARNHARM